MKVQVNSFGRVGVLMGGCSSERKISLKSGEAVLRALVEAGIDAREIIIECEDDEANQQLIRAEGINAAFIAMHGRYGEDGGIQAVLEKIGIPYAGSGPNASRVAINKAETQVLLKGAGLPVADFMVVRKNQPDVMLRISEHFNAQPVVVKPARNGSSIGIHLVRDQRDLEGALENAFAYDHEVLIERLIDGRELTVGILGEHALPVVEIKTTSLFFDYDAKYQHGKTEYVVPAELAEPSKIKMQELALKVFHVIGCRDFARIDFLMSSDGKPYILEANTIPGFTGTSLLPMAAKCAGYSFQQLCVILIGMALERNMSEL